MSEPDKSNWRPPLSGNDQLTDEALKLAYNHLFWLRDRITALSAIKPLTLEEIRAALELGGETVLNVTGLPGVLGSPQPCVIFGTHAERSAYSAVTYKNSLYVETDRGDPGGLIYYSNGSAWTYLSGTHADGPWFELTAITLVNAAADMTSGDLGLFVALHNFGHVVYRHNGTKLAYYSGEYPLLLSDIGPLIATLDTGNVSDNGLRIMITDRGNVIYTWSSALVKFTYTSGTYPLAFAGVAALAATLGADDTGLLIAITDRNNLVYQWSGTAFVATGAGGPYQILYAAKAALAATLGANDTSITIQITDWNNVIYTWSGTAFVFTSGEPVDLTQAALAAATITANDQGLRVYVTDYNHYLLRGAGAFAYDPHLDDLMCGAGPVLFEVDPGLGWHLYDGTLVSYLLPTGALATVTLPNLSGAGPTPSFLKASSASAGPTAAGGTTDPESAHVHSIDPPSTTSGAPSATVAVSTTAAAVNVGTETHTHDTDIAAFDSAAGSAHSHGPGTLEPASITRRAFFRQ